MVETARKFATEDEALDFIVDVGDTPEARALATEWKLDWEKDVVPLLAGLPAAKPQAEPDPLVAEITAELRAGAAARRAKLDQALAEMKAARAGGVAVPKPTEPEPDPEPEELPPSEPPAEPEEEFREAAEEATPLAPPLGGWAGLLIPSGVSDLERMTYVPGRVGRFIDWTIAGARRPNRMMALGVAVPLMGTVIGRWVMGPTGSATHDFTVILGPSGFGKARPMTAGTALLIALKLRQLIGDRDLASGVGYIKSIIKRPLQISFVDEVGDLLSRINANEGNTAVTSVVGKLKEAWNPWSWMGTGERSEVSAECVDWPCPSFVGACTPGKWFGALKPGDLETGFANRVLILPFEGVRLAPERDVPVGLDIPPKELVTDWEVLVRLKEKEQGDIMSRVVGDFPIRRPVGWTPAANDVYYALSRKMDALQDGDPQRFELCRRTCEHAVRWATNVAVGDDRWEVGQDDMVWAVGIAERSLDAACGGVEKFMRIYHDGPVLCEKILERLAAQTHTDPPYWRSEANLQRDFSRNQKWFGMIDAALAQLRKEERATRVEGREGKRGPLAKGWKLVG